MILPIPTISGKERSDCLILAPRADHLSFSGKHNWQGLLRVSTHCPGSRPWAGSVQPGVVLLPLQKGEAKIQLKDKVALVTGGARGLGRSMALAYAREGADVAVVARTPAELEAVSLEIRALSRRAHTVKAELTTSEGANRAVRETISELGKVDILVNNAGGYRLFTKGLTHSVSVMDITEEEWRRVMASNLSTTFMACKAVLPHMIERRSGVIVHLTSKNVARRGRAGQASYAAATKAAVERLSESLADEVKDFGIAVNILDSGWQGNRIWKSR